MDKDLRDNEYKCAKCGNIYEKGWSDIDAMEECVNMWGDKVLTPLEVVCHDCFNQKEEDK